MKRILSLALAGLMLISAIPMAYATNTYDSEAPENKVGTDVSYTNANASEWYTVSVPSKMRPGDTGTVALEGEWPSNRTLAVTSDAKVKLVNQTNMVDFTELNITFPGITAAGDNSFKKSYSEYIKVAEMPSNILFGTWSGIFNYNVEFDDGKQVELISFTFNDTVYQAEVGMTWENWALSKYNTLGNISANPDVDSWVIVYYEGFEGTWYLHDGKNRVNTTDVVISNHTYCTVEENEW